MAIYNSDDDWNSSFQTGLPGGRYCNVIDGVLKDDRTCSGSTITVASNGEFTFDVKKRNALAIHINRKL